MKIAMPIAASILLTLSACSDVEGHDHDGHDHHDHEHEVMTTVILTFTDIATAEELVFTWADPENDGSPVVDDILLVDGVDYAVGLQILNELEEPAEDITPEIADEDDEHQFFFTGSAVEGPATGANPDAVVVHAYADTDRNGLPLGLENDILTVAAGSGDFTVTLRHMPPESGNAVKVEGLAEDVAEGGFSSIGGADDIQITYSLTVE